VPGRGTTADASPAAGLFASRLPWWLALALVPIPSLALATGDTPAQKQAASRFASTGMAATLRRCELPRRCGGQAPTRTQKTRRETSNDFKVDQRTLEFDGLTIELSYLLEAPAPVGKSAHPYRDPQVLRLRLSDSRWPVGQGLGVGATQARVVRALGQGIARGACNEYVDPVREDAVTFCFEKGRVGSIEWVPWYDA
jgi:hypothetical protein